jgi:hypothetical protein
MLRRLIKVREAAMGTWGTDPFDNDSAMDLMLEWEKWSLAQRLASTQAMLTAVAQPRDD